MLSLHRKPKRTATSPVVDIYDGDTRLLAPWYFFLRVAEECSRCTRYERRIALVVLRPTLPQRGELREWLNHRLRMTDLATLGDDGQFYLLLPEADQDVAAEFANRLLTDFPGLSMISATFPSETVRFNALMAPLGQTRRRRAA